MLFLSGPEFGAITFCVASPHFLFSGRTSPLLSWTTATALVTILAIDDALRVQGLVFFCFCCVGFDFLGLFFDDCDGIGDHLGHR